jgi:hypothetical protein
MVPMDAGAAVAQVYNMQNQNRLMSTNEKIIGDKADDAMYKATELEYRVDNLTSDKTELITSEVIIYGSLAIIIVAVIFIYQSVM